MTADSRSTTATPLRVLRVVTLASATGKYGGPTDTALRQAQLLNSPAREVRVVAASFEGDAAQHPLLETATARPMFAKGGYIAVFSPRIVSLLVRSVHRADLVHISIAREFVPMFAAVVAWALRKPIVMQPHGMLTARTSSAHRVIDVLLRPLVARSRIVIALTEVERRALLRWLGRRDHPCVTVVGNPSPNLERRPRTEPPVALFAARLHPRKRVGDFVLAAKESLKRGYSIQWVVAGPDQGDLELVRAAMRDTPNLSYIGAISPEDVERRLSTAAVFVLPSRDEPWGNVIATAIKAQVPVVVPQSAAIAEEVERLGVGIVVADEAPGEIAGAVRALLSFAPASPAEHAASIEARFGNRGIAAALERVYEDAMDSSTLVSSGAGGSV